MNECGCDVRMRWRVRSLCGVCRAARLGTHARSLVVHVSAFVFFVTGAL